MGSSEYTMTLKMTVCLNISQHKLYCTSDLGWFAVSCEGTKLYYMHPDVNPPLNRKGKGGRKYSPEIHSEVIKAHWLYYNTKRMLKQAQLSDGAGY